MKNIREKFNSIKTKTPKPILKILRFCIKVSLIILFLILSILASLVLAVLYNLYRTEVSKSAILSKHFEKNLEIALSGNENQIPIKNLTDFEWDAICPFADFETLDLKEKNIVNITGFTPRSKTKYSTVHSDLNGIVFIDTKSQKIYALESIKEDYTINQKNYEMHLSGASCFKDDSKKLLTITKDDESPNLFFINLNQN